MADPATQDQELANLSTRLNNLQSSLDAYKASLLTAPTSVSNGVSPNPGAALQQTLDYAFEHVAATLVPFDLFTVGKNSTTPTNANNPNAVNALGPIIATNGLVFPYTPVISEGISVRYDSVDLTHSNESYYAYKSTENVRISLSECIWTCDTFDNALYAVAVLHFLRSYSFMNFGQGQTGRPPSPMWFSAYGSYAYNRVPCLLEKADWSFPNDIDYVGVPNPGSEEYINRELCYDKSGKSGYTWMPIKFTVSSISLIVQHAPRYWITWNLDDYRTGRMLSTRGGFNVMPGNT